MAQLDQLIADLKKHQTRVDTSIDRSTLLLAAVEFSNLSPRITDLSTSISYLVIYGNLQAVYDKTVSVKQDLQASIQQTEQDPLLLAQKNRGLDEVQRNLDQVNLTLVKIRAELNPQNPEAASLNSTTIFGDFSTVYGGLSRSESYLQELVKN